jgi:hypothetical protein
MASPTINSNALSNMSGLSEAELQRRAESLVNVGTGKIDALSALDAALAGLTTLDKPSMESFTAAGSASLDVHAIDDPVQAYTQQKAMAGFAPEGVQAPSLGGPAAMLEKMGKSGASKMNGFCCECGCPPPKPAVSSPERGSSPVAAAPQAPSRDQPSTPANTVAPSRATPQARRTGFGLDGSQGNPNDPNPSATPAAPSSGPSAADVQASQSQVDDIGSTDIQFEIIKNKMQQMSQIQDMMSNVVSSMHDQGMTAINNSKA